MRISGSVYRHERISMPPGYVVKAQLLDISRQDAAAEPLAPVEIRPKHQVPVPFSLVVDENRLDPRQRYSVRAQIMVEGRMLFTSAQTIRSRPARRRAG